MRTLHYLVYRFALVVLLVSTALGASGKSRIYMNDFVINPGETRTMYIMLENETYHIDYQFDITLPAGLELGVVSGRNKHFKLPDDFDFFSGTEGFYEDDNRWRYFVYEFASPVTGIEPGTYEILQISVIASDDFNGGEIAFTNCMLSNADRTTEHVNNTTCVVRASTPFATVATEGVGSKSYVVREPLAIAEVSDAMSYIFVTDGDDNWLTVYAGMYYEAVAGMTALDEGLEGVMSITNGNRTLTLTEIPVEKNEEVDFEIKDYDLSVHFAPKANEVINLHGYYIDGVMRAFSVGAGQSANLDFSWYNGGNTLQEGKRYSLTGVVRLLEAWEPEDEGSGAPRRVKQSDRLAFQNYVVYPTYVPNSPATEITDVKATGVRVTAEGGVITVTGADEVAVYDLRGALLSNAAKTKADAGVYIVVADGKAQKVLVK